MRCCRWIHGLSWPIGSQRGGSTTRRWGVESLSVSLHSLHVSTPSCFQHDAVAHCALPRLELGHMPHETVRVRPQHKQTKRLACVCLSSTWHRSTHLFASSCRLCCLATASNVMQGWATIFAAALLSAALTIAVPPAAHWRRSSRAAAAPVSSATSASASARTVMPSCRPGAVTLSLPAFACMWMSGFGACCGLCLYTQERRPCQRGRSCRSTPTSCGCSLGSSQT